MQTDPVLVICLLTPDPTGEASARRIRRGRYLPGAVHAALLEPPSPEPSGTSAYAVIRHYSMTLGSYEMHTVASTPVALSHGSRQPSGDTNV